MTWREVIGRETVVVFLGLEVVVKWRVKREVEFVKRFWRVSDIVLGNCCMRVLLGLVFQLGRVIGFRGWAEKLRLSAHAHG